MYTDKTYNDKTPNDKTPIDKTPKDKTANDKIYINWHIIHIEVEYCNANLKIIINCKFPPKKRQLKFKISNSQCVLLNASLTS